MEWTANTVPQGQDTTTHRAMVPYRVVAAALAKMAVAPKGSHNIPSSKAKEGYPNAVALMDK